METPERRANLLEEFKGGVHAGLGDGEGVLAFFPWPHDRAGTEGIRAHAAESMPVGNREAQVLAHRLAVDHLIGVVMMESQRAGRSGAFVGNGLDAREMGLVGFHSEERVWGIWVSVRGREAIIAGHDTLPWQTENPKAGCLRVSGF